MALTHRKSLNMKNIVEKLATDDSNLRLEKDILIVQRLGMGSLHKIQDSLSKMGFKPIVVDFNTFDLMDLGGLTDLVQEKEVIKKDDNKFFILVDSHKNYYNIKFNDELKHIKVNYQLLN